MLTSRTDNRLMNQMCQ